MKRRAHRIAGLKEEKEIIIIFSNQVCEIQYRRFFFSFVYFCRMLKNKNAYLYTFLGSHIVGVIHRDKDLFP